MTIRVYDEFTVGANINLDAHTPTPTGDGWTEEVRTGSRYQRIWATEDWAESNGSEASDRHIYTAQPNPTGAEYDVEFTLGIVATLGDDDALFAVARLTGSGDYYSAGVYPAAASADKKIFKTVGGTPTELASGTMSAAIADGDVLMFEVRDADKKLYKNAGEELSTSNNDITASGRGGFGHGNAWNSTDDISNRWNVDNFELDEVAAPGDFPLDVSPGSYAITGDPDTDVFLDAMINAGPSSYALTGDPDTAPLVGRVINAAPDSYAITGVAATLLRDAMINAAPDSYAITGINASLLRGLFLDMSPGTYAVTGIDAELLVARGINASPATYTVTGVDTTLLHDALLSLDPGGYSISGQAATLAFGYVMITDVGTYVVTGVGMTPLVGRGLNASPGVYTISGVAATLLADRLLSMDPSSYSLSGADVEFAVGFAFIVDPGVYSITGVGMTPLADRMLSTNIGDYFIARDLITGGQDMADGNWVDYGGVLSTNEQIDHDGQTNCRHLISTVQYRAVRSDPKFTTVTGVEYEVTFRLKVISGIIQPIRQKGDNSGAVAVGGSRTESTWTYFTYQWVEESGGPNAFIYFRHNDAGSNTEWYLDEVSVRTVTDASLVSGRVLSADPDSYSIAGQSASLVAGYLLVTDVGSYLVTGTDAALVVDYIINGAPGTYTLTGVDATLVGPAAVDFPLNVEPGVYALTGDLGVLLADRLLSAAPGAYVILGTGAILEEVYIEELAVYFRNRPLEIIMSGNAPFDVVYRNKTKKVLG